jgi:hypothetical protein
LAAALDDLGAVVGREPQFFESVFFQRDLSQLKAKALHYLPPEELARIEQQVAQAEAVLPRRGEPADPVARLARLNDELTHVASTTPEQRARVDEQYARVAGIVLAGLSGDRGANASSPGAGARRRPSHPPAAGNCQKPAAV